MPWSARGGFFFDQTYQSRYFESGSLRACLEPRVFLGRVVDDEIDEHANAALLWRRG